MRRIFIFALLVLAVLALADIYALYHLSVPGYRTTVFVSNMSEEEANFTISAFDCTGQKLWEDTYISKEYSTVAINLAEFIESNDDCWGLLLIKCDQLLHITAFYEDEEYGLLNTDHVIEPVQASEDTKYYWYAAGYVNKGNSETALVLINPNEDEASGSIWICNSNGETVKDLSGTIEPFSAKFFDLIKFIKDDVGVVDIQSDLPIIIGIEHYEDGEIWTIDNIVDWYTTTEW
ncbi:hypothetical protein [Thermotoga profunda]|uniref:hypothetical protein n=1 Tax=Thermotoga profunda TaxID=1508420 RepID=UPI000597478C|nr:hypothetical protein [Thermotoga profunda]